MFISTISTALILFFGLIPGGLCYLCVHRIFHVSSKWYKKGILLIACYLLSDMIIYVGDLMNLPPTLLFFLFGIWFCCEDSPLKKLSLALMLSTTAFSFNALCDNYLRIPLATPKIILRLFFWIFLYLLFRHFISQNTFELSKTYWSLMLLLTLTPLGIVISTILLQPEWAFDTKAVFLSSVVLLFLSLFSLIGLLITVSVLASHEKLQEEKHLLDLNVNYYKNMEQQQFEIRRLRHDMANHLQTLSTLPPDKMKEYINSLLADNAFTTTVVYCKDDIVNAVLNSKVSTMENEAISFSHELLISKALPYRPADLCALFANALDNAIEACCKLPADQRKIILAAKADKGLLAVQIENPLPPDCIGITDSGDRPFKKEGSFFKSTKKDASSHGYGLRSINEIVTRLQGSMEITEKDGMFCLFLYLPL